MMSFPYSMMFSNQSFGFAGHPLFWLMIAWSLVWKGLTLWVAARRDHTTWFVVFLVLNTAGIGEIIYLLVTDGFSEFKKKK